MSGSGQKQDTVENFVRANTRMIVKHAVEKPSTSNHRLYKCKDCSKEYESFQALGGHRASHRAPKPETLDGEAHSKPKLHQCKICKKGFEIGQSLGGHMRKHWRRQVTAPADNSTSSSSSSHSNAEVVFKYDLNLTVHQNEWNDRVRLAQDSSLDS